MLTVILDPSMYDMLTVILEPSTTFILCSVLVVLSEVIFGSVQSSMKIKVSAYQSSLQISICYI